MTHILEKDSFHWVEEKLCLRSQVGLNTIASFHFSSRLSIGASITFLNHIRNNFSRILCTSRGIVVKTCPIQHGVITLALQQKQGWIERSALHGWPIINRKKIFFTIKQFVYKLITWCNPLWCPFLHVLEITKEEASTTCCPIHCSRLSSTLSNIWGWAAYL